MAEDDLYTKDGTVDYRNNPAKRSETGTWKACPFILGDYCHFLFSLFAIFQRLFFFCWTDLKTEEFTVPIPEA